MKKAILISALAAGVLTLGACAKNKIHDCIKNPNKKIDKIVGFMGRKLDLSEPQKESVKDLLIDLHTEHKSMKCKHDSLRAIFKTQFLSESLNSDELTALLKEQMIEPGIDKIGETVASLHTILTSQQRSEMVRLIGKKHGTHCCKHN